MCRCVIDSYEFSITKITIYRRNMVILKPLRTPGPPVKTVPFFYLFLKEVNAMTLRELQEALNRIPKKGAVNLARRRAILAQIYKLMEAGE